MREKQIQQELLNMKQTSVSAFIKHLEDNKSDQVIKDMVDNISKGIKAYHDETQRKRAPFFKVTKTLSHDEVAFIGLKSILGTMSMTQYMTVVLVGKSIGERLFMATDRADQMHSLDENIIKEKTSAGIKLLDIIINCFPNNFFRAKCERLTATKTQWVLDSGDGFDTFREKHNELFKVLSRKLEPLICVPDDWTNMRDGGYLSDVGKKTTPLVKKLKDHAIPKTSLVFDAINHLQKTPFRVNKRLLHVCQLLQETKPKELEKLFLEDLGKFSEDYPATDDQTYIWEKVAGIKVDKKTGEELEGEVMKHMDEESVELRKKCFKWKARKAYHIKMVAAKKSIERSYATTIEVSESLCELEEIFWSMSLCRRSRVYPAAMSGINLQGADYQKAVVEFSVGLPLGSEDGVYAIQKTLCNHWGGDSGNGVKTDKLTRECGSEWVTQASRWIMACAEDPINNILWMKADKPLQFLVACFEWKDFTEFSKLNPNPFDFISRLCDPNDASCSGAQILSAMTRDDIGAMHTNLKNMEVQDLYMACADRVFETLHTIIEEKGENIELAEDWLGKRDIINSIKVIVSGQQDEIIGDVSSEKILKLHDKGLTCEEIYDSVYLSLNKLEKARKSLIIRNLVKKPVMVKFYSGTRYGNIEHCNEFIIKNHWEDNFRSESIGGAASFMGNLIYDAINKVISGAGLVMEWFVHVANVLGSKNLPVRWTTPIGFIAEMSKLSEKDVRINVPFNGSKDARFSLKIPVKVVVGDGWQYKLDVKKMKSGIAPDIVHSLDASLIMRVAARCKLEGINHLLMIHDSLGTHCCYSSKFNRIIREEFVKMFKEDLLLKFYEEFKSQLKEEDQHLLMTPEQFGIKKGTWILEEILSSEFSFK